MSRWIALVCAALMLCGMPALADEGENLIANGGFELVNAKGEPEGGWYDVAYRSQEGYSLIAISEEKAHTGKRSALIENASLNDARYVCTLRVEPNAMYRLSAYVLVEEMDAQGNGANLALEDIYSFSDCLYDTGGAWRLLEWYGVTDEDQREVTLGVRVGGYSAESVGRAYFDDVSLVKVDALPDGVVASLWYQDYVPPVEAPAKDADEDSEKSTALFCLLALAFVALVWLLSRAFDGEGRLPAPRSRLMLALTLLAALALRVALAMNVEGYGVDIGCFTSWALRMAQVGPGGFYTDGFFCDYPPGYMLLLWPCGYLLQGAWSAERGVTLLLVKLVPILCDLLTALFLYAFAKKRLGERGALLLALLCAFNPAALVGGAAWGQADSVLALMLMLTAWQAMQKRWRFALPLFAVSALIKPQALLLTPVGAVFLLISLLRDEDRKRQRIDALWGALFAALGCLALVLPFSVRQEDPLWLFALYGETLSSYAYATLNTANLFYLAGGNWLALGEDVPRLLPLLTGLAITGVSLGFGLRVNRGDGLGALKAFVRGSEPLAGTHFLLKPPFRSESAREREPLAGSGRALLLCAGALPFGLALLVLSATGCDCRTFGVLMMALVFVWTALCLVADSDAKRLPFYMALALIGLYVLGMKMHERYLYAALPLLLMAFALCRDRRLLVLLAGFSATTFVNTAIVLDNSILFGASLGHLNDDTLPLNILLAILNLLLCGYAVHVAYTGLRESPVRAPRALQRPNAARDALLTPPEARPRLTRFDWIAMATATALYACLAFIGLGSTVAPQTGWVSTHAEEQIVFELEREARFSLLYYGGISHYDFSVAISDDGVSWSEEIPCQMNDGLCYRWLYAVGSTTEDGETTYSGQTPASVLTFDGRYVRLTAGNAGLNLLEVIARDPDSGDAIPMRVLSHTGARDVLSISKPPENLVDERDTLSGEPSYYNSTYFDEIYYARTAYEHLHGLLPMETSHPPLGKLLMAVCVTVFGMTPFGWRFAGALTGVIMLPVLYLLALQLTRKRGLSLMAMLLLALDLMHLTQTRIATIDSFPVLFIMLSYLFMARYVMSDHFAVPQRGRWRHFAGQMIPLLLCGLFMGLGIASKWTGMYSAVGLAVLLFRSFCKQLRAQRAALAMDTDTLNDAQRSRVSLCAEWTLTRLLATCGMCVLFFIAIPALIYCLCYIPYLSPSGPVTLERIVGAQLSMFRYHSTPGLGMEHPFYSPWWQWPLILKPMWYCRDAFEPAGYASTIMCMGNPAIFYAGSVCMLGLIVLWLYRLTTARAPRVWERKAFGGVSEDACWIVVIGFLAQYLPWVLVPRGTYIYHFFASVPFIILATVLMIGCLPARGDGPAALFASPRWIVAGSYLLIAALLFAMFYPYASGCLTPTGWLDAMKWFRGIYY